MGAGASKAAANGFTLAEASCTHDRPTAVLDDWEASQLALGERLVATARERGDRCMNRR